MAAEVAAAGGLQVDLYDAMPSVGRKFLLAGKGGLNLTHSEPIDRFVIRYGNRAPVVAEWLEAFGPQALCDWASGLGVDTFVGTSGRVFPSDFKAAPLLRRWLQRLRDSGVRFHMRHRWLGLASGGAPSTAPIGPIGDGFGRGSDVGAGESHDAGHERFQLGFATSAGDITISADAVILALGGASWPQLGSNGAWVPWLEAQGIEVAPLRPSNCGFDIGWSEHLRSRFAGEPLKSVAIDFEDARGRFHRQGEFVVTEHGVEGSLVYAASARLRDAIAADGSATMHVDLLPDRSADQVLREVSHPRGSRSWSSHLESRLKLKGVKVALLHEVLTAAQFNQPESLAVAIKALPLVLKTPRPVAEAISTAGGVSFDALSPTLMVSSRPGFFIAGEMLDWEAPTGGYLLNACMASGVVAARSASRWVHASG
ncbi:MAG: hypothetical protein JWQ11_4619 [Rhizobacter sp.]|nr:hypothetical protein [Rhizobacter sp.]